MLEETSKALLFEIDKRSADKIRKYSEQRKEPSDREQEGKEAEKCGIRSIINSSNIMEDKRIFRNIW